MKRHSYLLGHLVFVAAAVFAVSASARSNQNSAPPQGQEVRSSEAFERSFQTGSARCRWTSRSLRNVD